MPIQSFRLGMKTLSDHRDNSNLQESNMNSSFPQRHTVMVVDDHDVVRHGLSWRLMQEDDMEVIGSHATSAALFASLELRRADVLVIDFVLGPSDIDRANLIHALHVKYPQARMLVISAHYTPSIVMLALQAGAHGFAGKAQPMDELVRAVRTVARGLAYVHDAMRDAIARTSRPLT